VNFLKEQIMWCVAWSEIDSIHITRWEKVFKTIINRQYFLLQKNNTEAI